MRGGAPVIGAGLYASGRPVVWRGGGWALADEPPPVPRPRRHGRSFRAGMVRDPLARPAWSHIVPCPRCRALTAFDDPRGVFCVEERACGWQSYYAAGTTHRADGSAIAPACEA